MDEELAGEGCASCVGCVSFVTAAIEGVVSVTRVDIKVVARGSFETEEALGNREWAPSNYVTTLLLLNRLPATHENLVELVDKEHVGLKHSRRKHWEKRG